MRINAILPEGKAQWKDWGTEDNPLDAKIVAWTKNKEKNYQCGSLLIKGVNLKDIPDTIFIKNPATKTTLSFTKRIDSSQTEGLFVFYVSRERNHISLRILNSAS